MHRQMIRVSRRLASASSRILSLEANQGLPALTGCPQLAGGRTNAGNLADGQLANREPVKFSRSFSSSTPAEDLNPERTLQPQYVGKTVTKLINAPKYVLKHELLTFFDGCDLTLDSVSAVVDDRLRMMHWRLVFDNEAAFHKALGILGSKRRMASRGLRLEQVPMEDLLAESDPKHPNRVADGFRGKSLVMLGLPEDVSSESVERFFEGYNLAPFSIRYVRIFHENVRTPLRLRAEGERRTTLDIVERRALVKFRTELDCYRALRELHKEHLDDRPIDLRILQ